MSIAFDGNDDYADTGLIPLATLGTALSASLWVYLDVTLDGETLFWLGRSSGAGLFNKLKYQLYHRWTTLQFRNGDGYSEQSGWNNAPTALTTGWYHFVISDTATNAADGICKLYVNDTLEITVDPSYEYKGTASWNQSNVTLGRWGYGGGSYAIAFDGNIDEVTLWDRALSEAEVTDLYNLGEPNDPTTLQRGEWADPLVANG